VSGGGVAIAASEVCCRREDRGRCGERWRGGVRARRREPDLLSCLFEADRRRDGERRLERRRSVAPAGDWFLDFLLEADRLREGERFLDVERRRRDADRLREAERRLGGERRRERELERDFFLEGERRLERERLRRSALSPPPWDFFSCARRAASSCSRRRAASLALWSSAFLALIVASSSS